jgi:hypothetical protein
MGKPVLVLLKGAAFPATKEEKQMSQRLMWVLWPAFLAAGLAEGIFFTLFDPSEMSLFGTPVEISRQAAYTLGFFVFWGLMAASSALTVFLQRSPFEVNRCPLEPIERPEGCPKREDPDGCCS